jgi:MOSC domain-containing protein YiiM
MDALVTAVSRNEAHTFSKAQVQSIRLLAGLGVEGDTHKGITVQHRSRVARDPSQPNLRQVHLIQAELFDELAEHGFSVAPGDMGENVTTRGVNIVDLPLGTRMQLGSTAVIELTGLRNPCTQLNAFQPGLMAATLARAADGELIRKAGVMAVVLTSGEVHAGDTIHITLPPAPHRPLEPV